MLFPSRHTESEHFPVVEFKSPMKRIDPKRIGFDIIFEIVEQNRVKVRIRIEGWNVYPTKHRIQSCPLLFCVVC